MCARFGTLSILPWILFAQMSWDMSALPAIAASVSSSEVFSEVNDPAGLFSNDGKREARQALRRIRYIHRVPILIETVKSFEGEALGDAARGQARPLGASAIHILVTGTGQDRDVAVTLGRSKAHGLLSDSDQAAIREAFLGPIQGGDADGGLKRGLRMVETTLANAAVSKPKSSLQDAVLPFTIFATLLVVLLAIQAGTGDEGRSKRGRRSSSHAREAVLPNVG